MNFHKETLQWMQRIENLCAEVNTTVKNEEQFINKLQLRINKENKELATNKKELVSMRIKISSSLYKGEELQKMKEDERDLVSLIVNHHYPEELKISNKGIFIKNYYSKEVSLS